MKPRLRRLTRVALKGLGGLGLAAGHLDSRESQKVLRQSLRPPGREGEKERVRLRAAFGLGLLGGLWVPSAVNVCSNFSTHFCSHPAVCGRGVTHCQRGGGGIWSDLPQIQPQGPAAQLWFNHSRWSSAFRTIVSLPPASSPSPARPPLLFPASKLHSTMAPSS